MKNEWLTNSQDIQLQRLLDRCLRSQVSSEKLSRQAQHLDEDSLTAFVEGNLSERETTPIISHLVDCSFCRHVTAELVRLDLAFADEVKSVAKDSQPSRISEVMSSLLARIFGTNDGAVFAHQEKEDSVDEPDHVKEEGK